MMLWKTMHTKQKVQLVGKTSSRGDHAEMARDTPQRASLYA
jgi:hypothetical protein